MPVLRRYGLLLAGALLLLAGGIVLATGIVRYLEGQQELGFGWTAYAPLESTTYLLPESAMQLVTGAVLMVLGLVAALVWFVIWRRRDRIAPIENSRE